MNGDKRGEYSTDWSKLIIQPNTASGAFAVVLGNDCHASHYGAILIGQGLKSDRDGQLKIGNSDNAVDVQLTSEQYMAFRKALVKSFGGF